MYASLGLLRYWKELLIGLLLLLCSLLISTIKSQNYELDLHNEEIKNIKKEHELVIQKLHNDIEVINFQAYSMQEKYDELQKQHNEKVKQLNSQLVKQRNEHETTYSKLVNTNNRLHNQIRVSNSRLSELSREANIDYSKRATEILAECSGRYLELARQATDLQVDRNALEDAFPKKQSNGE